MTKKNTTPKPYLSILLIVFTLFSSLEAFPVDSVIRIAAGRPTGSYYPVALQICSVINKYSSLSKCEVINSSGTINNLNLLASGRVDFAFVLSDTARDAATGKGFFEGQDPIKDLRFVLNIFTQTLTILAKDEKLVSTFGDLNGKKIGSNLRGATSRWAINRLNSVFKFDSEPKFVHLSDNQMATALCNDDVDAVALFVSHPNAIVSDISKSCNVEFVGFDPIKLDSFISANPFYSKIIINPGPYKNISRSTITLTTQGILVANTSTPKEKVDLLINALRRYFDDFQQSLPDLANMTKETIFNSETFGLAPY
ncbi:MAG: TAXI family TRAP transporter solute-binding subunit [Rickettsiaceae bacterium]|nr:TAXI family TRAP transporter solute-binding subunit [Rickettsiaceae bacterium]